MRLPKHHGLIHSAGRRTAVADLGLVPGQVRCFAHVQVDGGWGLAWVKVMAADAFVFFLATAGLNHFERLYANR